MSTYPETQGVNLGKTHFALFYLHLHTFCKTYFCLKQPQRLKTKTDYVANNADESLSEHVGLSCIALPKVSLAEVCILTLQSGLMAYFRCLHISFWYTIQWMLQQQQLTCILKGFQSVSDQIWWCTLKLLRGQIDNFENCGISSICACIAHGLQSCYTGCFWLFFCFVFLHWVTPFYEVASLF